ncbi:hypothetical protein [Actinoallomurus iriomotensis]|uniref:Uncharacterized protein n=1 Tax=Actinoallomurus iriomotensis TaxID=478107 RepID=A0A9W6RL42_9ACTN|nr:hypothetical protein [Actinoallomurus iriomotensis]GLY77504.1 hypothetical protein Airi01_057710 [Actinoallomurus iriomotensis]
MKKAMLAAVLVAAGSALATVTAVPAEAGTASPYPCGFFIEDGRSYYYNCSQFDAGLRVVHKNGQLTYACIPSYIMSYLGEAYDVSGAYTYKTC